MKEEKNIVVGDVGSHNADAGIPVKVGGKYSAAPTTLADGNRGNLQLSRLGYTPTVDELWANQVTKTTVAFDGATGNAHGEVSGTSNPYTLFTVTGDVAVKLLAVCVTTLTITATATLQVGVAGSTASLIALTAGDAIDAGEIWHDASPDAKIELSSVLTEKIIVGGTDIIETTATEDILTGVIKYICFWRPLSSDGNVVAA